MGLVPEKYIFLTTTPALWVKNCILYQLSQFETILNGTLQDTDKGQYIHTLSNNQFSCPDSILKLFYTVQGEGKNADYPTSPSPHTKVPDMRGKR